MMYADDRKEALRAAVLEARRFIEKADAAYAALDRPDAWYNCIEFAAAKRASMDLTRALVPVRNRRKK
jgi:hypothetical protein